MSFVCICIYVYVSVAILAQVMVVWCELQGFVPCQPLDPLRLRLCLLTPYLHLTVRGQPPFCPLPCRTARTPRFAIVPLESWAQSGRRTERSYHLLCETFLPNFFLKSGIMWCLPLCCRLLTILEIVALTSEVSPSSLYTWLVCLLMLMP